MPIAILERRLENLRVRKGPLSLEIIGKKKEITNKKVYRNQLNIIPYKKNQVKWNYKYRILLRKIFRNMDECEFPDNIRINHLHNVLEKFQENKLDLERENNTTKRIKKGYGEEGLEIFRKMRDYVINHGLEETKKNSKNFIEKFFKKYMILAQI